MKVVAGSCSGAAGKTSCCVQTCTWHARERRGWRRLCPATTAAKMTMCWVACRQTPSDRARRPPHPGRAQPKQVLWEGCASQCLQAAAAALTARQRRPRAGHTALVQPCLQEVKVSCSCIILNQTLCRGAPQLGGGAARQQRASGHGVGSVSAACAHTHTHALTRGSPARARHFAACAQRTRHRVPQRPAGACRLCDQQVALVCEACSCSALRQSWTL